MAYTLPDESDSPNKKDEVGFFESALAGVATGLWNIPKELFSLGAEVYDLVGDTNTAKEVEEWFDEVNEWDDEAEARTIGKVTQAITQVAPLAVGGAIAGVRAANLARKALAAKKAGKYMGLANMGKKILGTTELTTKGKLLGTAVGGGLGEAAVADEDIGTFADMAKGTSLEPLAITMMDRDTSLEGRADAYRRLKNRLKFGTEGAMFTMALIGAGAGIKKLRTPSAVGEKEYAETALGRMLQKFGLTGLKPENMGTKNILESRQYGIGQIRSVEFQAGRAVQEFQAAKGDLGNVIKNIYRLDEGQSIKAFNDEVMDAISPAIEMAKVMEPGAKVAKQVPFTKSLLKSQSKARGITQIDDVIKWKQMQDELLSLGEQKLKVSQNYKRALVLRETNEISEKEFLDIIKADKKLNKKLYELSKDVTSLKTRVPDIETLTKSVDRKGLFKLSDYRVSPKLKALLDKVASQGGDPTALKNVILNMRVAIDNMSGRLLQNTMPEDIAKNIKGQLGSYMTTLYEQFEKSGPLMKYEPTAAQIIKAKDLLRADKVKALEDA